MNTETRKSAKEYLNMILLLSIALLCSACATQDGTRDVASNDRECRTTQTTGSKLRQSVCLSKEEWARIDARDAATDVKDDQTDEFFRRALEQATQSPPAAFDSPTGAP